MENQNDPGKRMDRLWAWLAIEETIHVYRLNFFLVGEAMLLAGFATVLSAQRGSREVSLMLGLVGIVSSLIWAYSSWIQRRFTIDPIHVKLQSIHQDFNEITSHRAKLWFRIPVNVLMGIIFPLFLAAVWLFLLVIR